MSNVHRTAGELGRSIVCTDAKAGALSDGNPAFPLTVLFTTVPATLAALRGAAKLAHELGASIRVLAATVVPYPLDLNRPRIDPAFRFRHFRTSCEEHSVEMQIDVRLCRDARRCIHDSLAPRSLVLIGSRSWWPLSSEKRLARSLRQDGHEVIVVEKGKEAKMLSTSLCALKAPGTSV